MKVSNLLLALFFTGSCLAQSPQPGKKPAFFSFQLSLTDYQFPATVKATSLNEALQAGNWYRPGNHSFGFGAAWWKPLQRHIDFSAGLTGTFANFPALFVKDDSIGQAGFSIAADALLHLKALAGDRTINPFLTAGLGFGSFRNRFAAYAPLGAGLQFRFNEGALLLLQAQWRKRLTDGIQNDYLHYSLGFAQLLGRKKKAAAPPVPTRPALPPDSDGDGIEDAKDECPNQAGTVKGCPDRDGDGVPDKDDRCPNEKGTVKGCPDRDGDGIADKEDRCPDVAGLERYSGCPIPDTDGDGINDEEDACPTQAGLAANKGCPEIKEEVKQKLNLAARNIQFRFASDELLPASFGPLNEVVKLLQDNPELKLRIEAHADNRGLPERNMMWSERRAKAVANYFIGKGIAPERISYQGFGDTRPIADNRTEQGRAQNRRVEMKLSY
ncbi:MAG: OmpA family protein [Lacibacter sp.]